MITTEGKNFGNDTINASINITQSVVSIINDLLNKGFPEAEESLKVFLQDKERVIVLIDSLNEYDVNNKELTLAVKALIQSCFDFYNSPEEKILLKISLPSEIYNKVLTRLPAKQSGNTVVIQWKVKELVIFLALRLFIWFNDKSNIKYDFCKGYTYQSFYSDIESNAYNNAKAFIIIFFQNYALTAYLLIF